MSSNWGSGIRGVLEIGDYTMLVGENGAGEGQ